MTEENGKKGLIPVRAGRLPTVSQEKAPLIKRAMRDVAEGILGQPAGISRPMHKIGRFEFLSDDYQQIVEWAPLFGFENDLEGLANYLEERASEKQTFLGSWLSGGRIMRLVISGDQDDKELPLRSVPELRELWCPCSGIEKLDLSKVSELKRLDCAYNEITDLDLLPVPKLEHLDCDLTSISQISLSNVINLTYLSCNGVALRQLCLKSASYLRYLSCSYTEITELDLSPVPNLRSLGCSGTNLNKLDISHVPGLKYFYYRSAKLRELDLSCVPNIRELDCRDNYLVKLDLSNSVLLETLLCDDNQLLELDISPCLLLCELAVDEGVVVRHRPDQILTKINPTRDVLGYQFTAGFKKGHRAVGPGQGVYYQVSGPIYG